MQRDFCAALGLSHSGNSAFLSKTRCALAPGTNFSDSVESGALYGTRRGILLELLRVASLRESASLEEELSPPLDGAALAAAPTRRVRTFASLRHIDYRYLWTGTLMMSAGQWVQQVTLGWLLYDLTGNSMLLGALNGLRALPFLITGPLAGVAADRMDRRKLLLQTQTILVVTALLMGALVASPFLHVWHIFLFTLITGIAWTITEPVRMSTLNA